MSQTVQEMVSNRQNYPVIFIYFHARRFLVLGVLSIPGFLNVRPLFSPANLAHDPQGSWPALLSCNGNHCFRSAYRICHEAMGLVVPAFIIYSPKQVLATYIYIILYIFIYIPTLWAVASASISGSAHVARLSAEHFGIFWGSGDNSDSAWLVSPFE